MNDLAKADEVIRMIVENPESCKQYAELFLEGFLNALKDEKLEKKINDQFRKGSGFYAQMQGLQSLESRLVRIERTMEMIMVNTSGIAYLVENFVRRNDPEMAEKIDSIILENKDEIEKAMGALETDQPIIKD